MISTSTSNVLSPTSAFHLMVTDHKCRTLLTFENKRQYFLDNLRKPHVKSGALLNEVPVRVRRSHILEDSFHVLASFIRCATVEAVMEGVGLALAASQ